MIFTLLLLSHLNIFPRHGCFLIEYPIHQNTFLSPQTHTIETFRSMIKKLGIITKTRIHWLKGGDWFIILTFAPKLLFALFPDLLPIHFCLTKGHLSFNSLDLYIKDPEIYTPENVKQFLILGFHFCLLFEGRVSPGFFRLDFDHF
jgi:hypothetical protein